MDSTVRIGAKFATSTEKMEAKPLDIAADADHAIVWRNDRLYLLDQRLLPEQESYLELQSAADTAGAAINENFT